MSKAMEHVVFTIGRMNPPTKGHQKLIDAVLEHALSNGYEHRIFVTRTHDRKKNPLTLDAKLAFMARLFPGVVFRDALNVFIACKDLAKEGFKSATLVVGEDRNDAFLNSLRAYIDHPDPQKSIGLQSIDQVFLPRGSDDFSATAARNFALGGDFENFKIVIPTSNQSIAREIYKCVRQGLGVDNGSF